MDGTRFDAMTKWLTLTASRRGVPRLLAGGTLAVLLSRIGRQEVAAAGTCRAVGRPCQLPGQCCTHACRGHHCRSCGATEVCSSLTRLCGPGRTCQCYLSATGQQTCFAQGGCGGTPCTSNSQCPAGSACQANCCSSGNCQPLCGAAAMSS